MIWNRWVEVPLKESILLSLGKSPRRSHSSPSPRIAVIGAGLAGLVAAYEAKALGYDVTVFEGRKHRLGGRAHTITTLATRMFAEGGPEFISKAHGLILAYLKLFGLSVMPVTDCASPFFPVMEGGLNGYVSSDEVVAINREMSSVREPLNRLAQTLHADAPWKGEHATQLDATNFFSHLGTLGLSEATRRAFFVHLEGEHGVHPERIGLLPYLYRILSHEPDGYWEGFEAYRVVGGISGLIAIFEKYLHDTIRQGIEVRRVEANATRVKVVQEDGKVEEFDEAVITVPPSLWDQQIHLEPCPELTQRPQMGKNVKLLLRVPATFPIRWGVSPVALKNPDALIQMVWEATLGQTGDWRILTGMSGGEAAARIVALRRDQAIKQAIAEMELYMPGLRSAVGAAHLKDWARRRLTQAGYSCPAPGEVTTIWPRLHQAHDSRMHFAGEPYDPRAWALMQGAAASALSVVANIHQRYSS